MNDEEVNFVNKDDFINKNQNENNDNKENNEEIVERIKDNRKIILTVIIYLLLQFIVSGIIAVFIAALYSSTHKEIDYNSLLEAISKSNIESLAENYKKASILINTYTNFLSYLMIFIALILLCKKFFIKDLEALLKKPKFYAIFIPVAAIAFLVISTCIDKFVSIWAKANNNQSIIELMIRSENGWMIVIMVVLFAPIIEEFVYRFAIFRFTKRFHIAISYIASTILFALPHVITTSIEEVGIGIWLLQTIPYLSSGVMFSLIYHKSNENLYASICAHMLNNLFAVILIFM